MEFVNPFVVYNSDLVRFNCNQDGDGVHLKHPEGLITPTDNTR